MIRSRSLCVGALAAFAAARVVSADLTPDQTKFFEGKIRPLLSEKCYKCHSTESGKSKGGLTMDTKESMLKGGENGPAVKPGDVDGSLLLKAVSYTDSDLQMPPKGEKLSDAEIATLTEWVKMGAPDPRTAAVKTKLSGLTDKARSHWAYQPVTKPAVPTPKNHAWCVTPIDSFILDKLESKNMLPGPDLVDLNGKMTLLRRATYDLIGLPPTLEEINNFITDESPDAFSKVVDRLLASPRYGERWGRYWLDSARYADTVGVRNGNNEDYRLPYAYTYRDWVISAFNDNMPYDQFIMQQLAADQIKDNPRSNLAALGLLTVGERFQNPNDVINDRIDTVSKGFLAMTVACARCHDHMFDPIPTKDYYALHGIFASIAEPKEDPVLREVDPKAQAEFQQKLAALDQQNRDEYYKLVGAVSTTFREKAASYILVAHLGRKDSSQENQQKAEKISDDEKLDRVIVNEIRNRLTNRDNDIFGPFARFLQGGDSWKVIADQISKDKKYNPLVAAAFKDANPKTFEDLAAIYGKVFSGVEGKADGIIKAFAAAKVAPATAEKSASAADPKGNGMVTMASMKPDSMMMMGMMSGSGTDSKTAALAGLDPAVVRLAVTPLSIEPAYALTTDELRNFERSLPNQLRGRGKFSFTKINELLLTDVGAAPRAMVVVDKPKPQNSPVFIRGQAETHGEIVPRHFLEVLSDGKPQPFKIGSGRLELAEAIASKKNPLTARVMVNRIWMHHFGQGFVRTLDDLGTQSEAPSHPELLDYLASWFMDQGWDIKKLHKFIMLSHVYRESSDSRRIYETVDPDNRYLWRANIRRLDFEAMRDSLLVMAGKLDTKLGGQPVNLTDEPYSHRRSVYGYVDRGNLPELMTNFDFSNPDMPNSARTTTVVPQQALFLMNSPMVEDVARSITQRQDFQSAGNWIRRLDTVFKIVYQRSPKSKEETQLAVNFIESEAKDQPAVVAAMKNVSGKATDLAKKRADERAKSDSGTKAIQNEGDVVDRTPLEQWATFAQALLMTNEAAYVN
jgi:Protein of unknown function (DUF1553)/Protein of unknown function (DUF1549)/Planctomycete cytochrome C